MAQPERYPLKAGEWVRKEEARWGIGRVVEVRDGNRVTVQWLQWGTKLHAHNGRYLYPLSSLAQMCINAEKEYDH
jgi:hypothetical protein